MLSPGCGQCRTLPPAPHSALQLSRVAVPRMRARACEVRSGSDNGTLETSAALAVGGPDPPAEPLSSQLSQPKTQSAASATWQSLVDPDILTDIPLRSQGSPSTSGRDSAAPAHHAVRMPVAVWKVLAQYKPAPRRTGAPGGAPLTRRLQHGGPKPQAKSKHEVELHQEAMLLSKSNRIPQAVQLLEKGHQRYPGNVYFPHSAAVLCARQGKHDRARQLFKAALAISPTNGASLQAWALLEAKLGNVVKARELFKEAGEVDSSNTATWCAWALFEDAQGDKQAARQIFQKALAHNPLHEPSLNAFARLEMQLNHWESAQSLLQRVLTSNPRHAHSWVTLGRLCFQQGDFEQGRQMFKCVARYCGDDAVALTAWADMELRVGETVRAHGLLEKALRVDKTNMPAWLLLASFYARAGSFQKALRTYEAALRIEPGNKYLQVSYSQFLLSVGQTDNAKRMLLTLSKKHPNNGQLWNALGMLELRAGELAAAAECFKKGLRDPDSATALLNYEELANLAAQEGRHDIARELFQRGAQVHAPSARFLRMWALFEKRVNNVDRARTLLRSSLDCNATDVKSWIHLGLLERRQGDLDEALRLFEEALKVTQHNHHLWYLYCETATRVKTVAECREIFRLPRATEVWSPQLCMLEAIMEWRGGDADRARAHFHASANLSRGNPQYYSPVFEAWARFEESQNDGSRASALMAEFQTVFKAEQEQQSRKRSVEPLAKLDGMLFEAVNKHVAGARSQSPVRVGGRTRMRGRTRAKK